jgi:hypothetical protein
MAIEGMITELVAQAKQVKETYVADLLSKRNVVGVGLGYKISKGVSTGELGLIVSVKHKADVSALAAKDLVPQALDGFKTDVVETGVFRALDLNPRSQWRPAPPGVSIGHPGVTAGTFGCLVRRGNEVFILSNNHILADVNEGQRGDPILQPGVADGGTADDRIATLADYIPIDFGTSEPECSIAEWITKTLNYVAGAFGSSHQLQAVKKTPGVNRVDAALARPLSPDLVKNEILIIGAPVGVGTVVLGMDVQKAGRTTGYTTGKITQIDATVRIDYEGPSALFTGQIVASPMSQGGDSGSAVLDMDDRVVGLLFAGSDAATIINPISEVFSALNVELAL